MNVKIEMSKNDWIAVKNVISLVMMNVPANAVPTVIKELKKKITKACIEGEY